MGMLDLLGRHYRFGQQFEVVLAAVLGASNACYETPFTQMVDAARHGHFVHVQGIGKFLLADVALMLYDQGEYEVTALNAQVLQPLMEQDEILLADAGAPKTQGAFFGRGHAGRKGRD